MSYCIVTALYQLNDGNTKRRSIQKYIESLSYLYNIGVPVVIFTDMLDILQPIYPNLQYQVLSRDNIPVYNKIMQSNAKVIPYGFDTTTKMYSIVTVSKPYFIDRCNELYPNFTHYIWMDAGISTHDHVPYESLREGINAKLHDKITVVQMRSIMEHEKEGLCLLSRNGGIIAASIISVPKNLTHFLWDRTIDAVEKMLEHDYLCLDEQVLAYINGKNMDMFDYWYSDYDTLPNLTYINKDHSTVIRNMVNSEDIEHSCEIAVVLLNSIEFIPTFPLDLIPDILFNIQHRSYYVPHVMHKDIPLHILVSKIIHYLHVKYNVQFPDITWNNIKYSGVNVDDQPEQMHEIMPYVRRFK